MRSKLFNYVFLCLIIIILCGYKAHPDHENKILLTRISSSDSSGKVIKDNILPGFKIDRNFNEQTKSYNYSPEVKVFINAPAPEDLDRRKQVNLILFALPNGNTTEQTIGKKLRPNDDWHFDIQHIGAQTRFLREYVKEQNFVVAYLETEGKSWPSWRRRITNSSSIIKDIVDSLRNTFRDYDTRVTLTGHSGGGSFIFGFLNSSDSIPDYIDRIGFLDSDYAYDDSLKHGEKITEWLKRSDQKHLCVIAYNDSVVIFNGKSLVSPTGGTWYRSKLLKSYLNKHFIFQAEQDSSMIKYSSLNNRIKFFLKENPSGEILHTVQVEKNGFIEVILSGTNHEEKGYRYFGERAYSKWIK